MTLSRQELDRAGVIEAVAAKRLRQAQAAEQLGISVRQVKRLVQRYRAGGAGALASRRRGRPSNHRLPEALRVQAVALVREHYGDFGPTLAHEKLTDIHGLACSVETLRQWMIAEELWRPRPRKRARIHQRRVRRPARGELVQIDGSPHAWFEDRAAPCTLIVFIDDATGELLALRFVPAETTQAYMQTLQGYLAAHGRPVALYSDKHSIFRVNHPERDGELTQFSRALKTLDIEAIHANTPQAKGRVERANQTLQDRLVKELRLQGVSDMDTANAFLPAFIRAYNARFAIAPRCDVDAHRDVLHDTEELALILSLQHTRRLSKNLTVQFQRREYQLRGQGQGYRLRGAAVTVSQAFDGRITILHKGRVMPYRLLAEGQTPAALDDEKSVHLTVDQAKARQATQPRRKPAVDHPWNRMARIATIKAARD